MSKSPVRYLTIGTTVLAAASLFASAAPTMWAWGLAGPRFVPLPWRWLWAIPLIALLPTTGPALLRAFSSAGNILLGRLGALQVFMLGALFVAVFPDRTWFTGDFLQRLSGIIWHSELRQYVGAMPVDWLLHFALPELLLRDPSSQALAWLRVLGAIQAGLLALSARAWVRWLGLTGAEAAAGIVLVFATASLAVYTGLGKPAAALGLVILFVLLKSDRVVSGDGGALALGIGVSFALLLHRSGVLILPVWVLASAIAFVRVRHKGPKALIRLTPLAIPVIVLTVAWPRLVSALLVYDIRDHLVPGRSVTGQTVEGGWLSAVHLADVSSALLCMAPAFALALPSIANNPQSFLRNSRGRVHAALAAVCLIVVALVFPQQGVFRDLDVFAPWMIALEAIGIAVLVDHVAPSAERALWLSRAALVVAALGLSVIVTYANNESGLARVRAYVAGPPIRDITTQSRTWDFMIGPYIRIGRLDLALDCLDHAIALAPHRRLFLTRALVLERLGQPRAALDAYAEVVRRWPDDALGWFGLAGARLYLGDRIGSDLALARTEALLFADPSLRDDLVRYRRQFPIVWPGPAALVDSVLGVAPALRP